jgi:hypothetical protein
MMRNHGTFLGNIETTLCIVTCNHQGSHLHKNGNPKPDLLLETIDQSTQKELPEEQRPWQAFFVQAFFP